MKTIKKNVYYCEFCKKKGLSKYAITTHEEHCTGNINRHCRMCDLLDLANDIKPLIEKYKNSYELVGKEEKIPDGMGGFWGTNKTIEVKWKDKPVLITDILDSVDGCPMCALAILRLSGMNRYYFGYDFKFNELKKEALNDSGRNREDER